MATATRDRLADRAAIEDVLSRYFTGLDRGDMRRVRSCFTEDVQAQYHDHAPDDGIESLMGWLDGLHKGLVLGRVRATMHFKGQVSFERLENDVAETETYTIAFVVRSDDPSHSVAIRGLRYLDRFRRVGDEWKISHRQHTLDWAVEEPATFATTLATRVMKLAV